MKLREIVRDFYGVDQPQGCTEEEIAAMKERFGAIPAVVEDFWRTFGHTRELNQCQDNWIFPEQYSKWKWLEEYDDLILLNENQGVFQACVQRADLSLPDPPVYEFVNNKARERISPSVSQFLEAALLYESVFQLECSPEEFFELPEEDLEVIQAKLTKRSAVLESWMEFEVTFYSSRPGNLVVVMDLGDQYQMLYGASSRENYAALLDVMEGLGEPI
ncbi:hypothetical protein AALA54_11165 [Oscillospiraceae bacterium 44-34]